MDRMNFPQTVDEFMEQYKIVDREEVYTNGAELIPIFRMKQWFEHEALGKDTNVPTKWIPVSERLPKIGRYVLCFLGSLHYMGPYRVCKYCPADKHINHPYFDFNENGLPDVVAWMPLPEPWKGEG